MHLSPLVAWSAVRSKAMGLLWLIDCYVHFSSAIILKRNSMLVALLLLSYRCIVTINVLWLFLSVPWVCLQCVIVVFPDHTHYLFERMDIEIIQLSNFCGVNIYGLHLQQPRL